MDISAMTEEQIRSMLGDLIDEESELKVKKVKFPTLKPQKTSGERLDINFLSDVMVDLMVELGQCELTVREILELDNESVIELNKLAGEEVEVFVNGQPLATAEVVIINDAFGVRINSFFEGTEE